MPVFTSPDDTVLEYELNGDPDGKPVVVHHGLLGSAGIGPEWHELALKAKVGLITVARPGYGRSEPVAMTSIAEWAALLTPLLDELGVEQFGVIGISAGAPYSYALAAALPERVERVAILSGLGKVNEPETRALYPEQSRQAFELFGSSPEDEVRAYWHTSMQASLLQLPEDHPFARPLKDTLAHEAAGPGREAVLQQREWGFDLESLSVPITLWHSRADDQVPHATAEIVAARIPGAQLREQELASHVPSPTVAQEALEYLS